MGNRIKTKSEVINGIILLNKPEGLSSNGALQRVKWLLNARKAGHTGSLDPIATGVLPICLGYATKVSEMFLNSDKKYLVGIRLGVSTDSGDKEGEVIKKQEVTATRQQIEDLLADFTGEIDQIPPMYSALKLNGQPLYKLARKGVEVERKPRKVTVYELNFLDFSADLLTLEIHCSKGFYVRSLAMDLGNLLGCGGHVETLQRTSAGKFDITNCVTLEQLEALEPGSIRQSLIIPLDETLDHLPKVDLPEKTAEYFCQGQPVSTITGPSEGMARLYSENNTFLGLGEVMENGQITPKRVFV